MERVRSAKLDSLCESIGDERETMNKARTEEKGLIISALTEMQRRGVQVYKHASIELARVPGSEKLRVRLIKEQGDADEADLEEGEVTDEQLEMVDAKHDAEDAEEAGE